MSASTTTTRYPEDTLAVEFDESPLLALPEGAATLKGLFQNPRKEAHIRLAAVLAADPTMPLTEHTLTARMASEHPELAVGKQQLERWLKDDAPFRELFETLQMHTVARLETKGYQVALTDDRAGVERGFLLKRHDKRYSEVAPSQGAQVLIIGAGIPESMLNSGLKPVAVIEADVKELPGA